jgi:hypothetical protein
MGPRRKRKITEPVRKRRRVNSRRVKMMTQHFEKRGEKTSFGNHLGYEDV